MQGQGRPNGLGRGSLLAMLSLVFLEICASQSFAEIDAIPVELLTDAELCDVCFIDPQRGWAVGDRGVIRQTDDGGRHWRLQHSPVACRLESVCFLDDRNGWIVGGWTQPYTHKGQGVVLRTHDGGQHWEPIPRLSLPALRRVKFFDAHHGWAVADPSDMYPAGVFRTDDGGLSWYSLPAQNSPSWLDGDALAPETGATVGWGGAIGNLTDRGLEPARAPDRGLRNLHCLRFAPREMTSTGITTNQHAQVPFGWAVGDGGLALLSVDGGRSWHEPLGGLPRDARQIDFHAVAARGKSCWIAGTPGTHVLHSPDGGTTWQVCATGQSLPIRALTFQDENRGWAVGALGTILATRDGGRTWTGQRQGTTRAALLGIVAQPRNIPMEILANLAADEGYVSVVEILTCTPSATSSKSTRSIQQRAHEAVVAVGATAAETAWRFPLRYDTLPLSTDAIVADWNGVNAYGARERLLEHIVRKIRMWRPEVIVTEPPSLEGDAPLSQLVNQTVIAAIEKAADDSFLPDASSVGGLRPWRVKKVYSSLGGDVTGTINLTTSQLAPRLGCSLADRAQLGWQLLLTDYQAPPHTYGFRLLVNRLSNDDGRRDFFSGISLPPGGEARRAHHSPPPGDLRSLTQAAQQRRNVDHLLDHLATAGQSGPAWLGQVENLMRGLDVSAAGQVLFRVAQKLQDAGHADLAADVYDLLTRRCGQHESSDAALMWLVQYHASAEAAWAFGRNPRGIVQTEARPAAPGNAYGAVQQAVFQEPSAPSMTGTLSSEDDPHGTILRERARRAVEYGQLIQNTKPSLHAAPEIRIPLAQADRVVGNYREAEAYFHALASSGLDQSWLACAGSELWLMQSVRKTPKPTMQCIRANQRPRLDGCLDDTIWTQVAPAQLSSPYGDDQAWTSAAMLAHDGQFLYLAAQCRKTPNTQYPTSDDPRPRDADLKNRDRLELLIDVDRDYATCYRLAVDHRGWVWEACAEIEAWNPDWYVAAAEDDATWTIEAAIPFDQIVASAPAEHDAWAVGLRRISPHVGFQSWTPSESPHVSAADFGLLIFR